MSERSVDAVAGQGPLAGVRIVEYAGIGAAPFGTLLLANLGAEVIRIDRVSSALGDPGLDRMMDSIGRGRRSIAIDLKQARGTEIALELSDSADVVVEGFRPGVMDRLGLGPAACLTRNPRLIFAQVTGWGQSGPLRDRAGHDINYAALAGAVHGLGEPSQPPPPPLNYVANSGGGGAFLAIGVLAALVQRQRSGRGEVLDVAMLDGSAALTSLMHGLAAMGEWSDQRGSNLVDGSHPYYRCYGTSDGKYMAVGAIEPKFYRRMLEALGLNPASWDQQDRTKWPDLTAELGRRFSARTRDEWTEHFADIDSCVTPVLSIGEAPLDPHNASRGVFVHQGDYVQPAAAPRFRESIAPPSAAPMFGGSTREILGELGRSVEDVDALFDARTVA
ncbi:CaiB/BaiF CoA transferase family protein [Jatrophihabitans sp. DSM 45814]